MSELVYGRRVPGQEQVVVETPKEIPQEVVVDAPKKKSFFDKPVISKELYAEINLFIPQMIGLVASVMVGLFVITLSRLQSTNIYASVKDKVGEEAAGAIASQLNGFNSLVLVGVLLPIIIYAGFVLVKFLFFMPRKNRNIVHRIFKGRAILTSVEKVDPKMLFDKGNKKTEVMVTNPGKHYDYLTNRPILYLREEERTNVSVMLDDLDLSGKGRDTDSMVANAFHTGYEIARDKLQKEEKYIKILMVLMIVVLAAVGLVGMLVYRQPELLKPIIEAALNGAAPTA